MLTQKTLELFEKDQGACTMHDPQSIVGEIEH